MIGYQGNKVMVKKRDIRYEPVKSDIPYHQPYNPAKHAQAKQDVQTFHSLMLKIEAKKEYEKKIGREVTMAEFEDYQQAWIDDEIMAAGLETETGE